MTDISTNKPPIWFWVIAVVALVWNLMGVMAYIGQAYMTEAELNALPEVEQALYANYPAWATAAFAIAVFGGAIASIALLLRKKLAKTLFLISLIGIIVQMIYNFFISEAMDVYGPGGMIMPVMIIIIGVYLVMLAKKSISNNWIS
ncbi:hypothetical protein [Xanthomarina spongicola]|uniref:Sugar transporter n=1 Tax=Xanthomarina spongicola TaxID=570520 RepID=A0A316EAJ1_9FLAO|nr:hypothetical protein [Xanthomarina spongicola]PWK19930.1 hypothetical protein LX78_01280 [Xanthomarina spongicola]